MLEHLRMMARYNAWANRLLYDRVADLSEDEFRRDTGLFFRSLHGTLNHLVGADTIWMARLEGKQDVIGQRPPARLDDILFEDFDAMRDFRGRLDAHIQAFMNARSEADIAADFTYTPITDPTPVTQGLAPALAHVFNHQTHHRGQCHAGLTAMGLDAPAMDLIYFQRHERLNS